MNEMSWWYKLSHDLFILYVHDDHQRSKGESAVRLNADRDWKVVSTAETVSDDDAYRKIVVNDKR